MSDHFLFRPYTGSQPGYVMELVVYSSGGVQFAVIPVAARKALQDGLALVERAGAELVGHGAQAHP